MTPEELHKIIKADESKTWYNLKEIAHLANTDPFSIQTTLNQSNLFVRSSSKFSEQGEPLYTTLSDFTRKASFSDKLVGAFRNRID